ncbi:phosphoglycerol transferase MdoB-like AlkP superfamily enzyme [Anaerotaenia torta]|uniref:LTA synthase family protein n=1 Tax=Anaerotaenia torta TaxID=433293 RepID=UPI003D1E5CDE
MKKLKEILASPYLIALLFVGKMAVYYSLIRVHRMEIVMIAFSLIVWAVIFLGFGRCGLKRKRGIFLIVYFLLSLLMFADTMYYNYYNQTVSIKQLWQAKSVTAVPKSFIATIIPSSFLLFLDIPFAYHSFQKYASRDILKKIYSWRKLKYLVYVLTAVMITLCVNPFRSAAIERVNSMEFFTSHVTDIYETISDHLGPEKMQQEEILEVLDQVVPEPEAPRYRGIGEGKNLIVIQLEAVQDFVIGAKYQGQEITPNLNRLAERDTLYFDHYYTNVGKGNTADAEFTSMNSLYPVADGESYRLYEANTFHGLPWLLREKGYYAFAVHGFEGSFWNRENAYPYQGFQDFYSMEDLNQDEMIGMGISDKSMFGQLVPILRQQTSRFFTFAITLSNHHPFDIDEQYRTLTLAEEDENTKFGDYLQSVHYTDEAIGQLIADLKEAGLYEDTIIALYGDHHGLNCGMDEVTAQMNAFLGRTYDYDEMLNVPLIIHVPGSGVRETIHTTGGQVDFMPTMANIMGLSLDDTFIVGQDLSNAKEGFVAFTSYLLEGSFATNDIIFEISRGGIFEGSRAWKIGTNEEVDASLYREQYERAILLKTTSKEILGQNLMANFITNEVTETEDEAPEAVKEEE